MSTKRKACRRARRGLTLLEVVIASSMLAMLMTSISLILRTSRDAWVAHEADFVRVEAAHATLRHIVREIRQSKGIVSISPATDNSGQLSLLNPSGLTYVWDHSGTNVNFGIGSATSLLAPNITGLRLTGYQINGTTPTTVADDVQCIRIDLSFLLPRDTGGARTVSSWAWVRSWQ